MSQNIQKSIFTSAIEEQTIKTKIHRINKCFIKKHKLDGKKAINNYKKKINIIFKDILIRLNNDINLFVPILNELNKIFDTIPRSFSDDYENEFSYLQFGLNHPSILNNGRKCQIYFSDKYSDE